MTKFLPEQAESAQVNTILQLIHNPCDEPWVGYILLAAKPLGQAALKLVQFGMGDVIRGAARPSFGRQTPHVRRGAGGRNSSRGKKPRGIPEIGNMIGAKLFTEELQGRQVPGGARLMWEVDGVLQRLFWNFLVADIVDDFVVNWTSSIIRADFCTRQFAARCYRRGEMGTVGVFIGWRALPVPALIYGSGGLFGVFNVGPKGGFASATVEGDPVGNPLVPKELDIRMRVAGQPTERSNGESFLGERTGATVGMHIPPNAQVITEVAAFGADFVNVSTSFFAVSF